MKKTYEIIEIPDQLSEMYTSYRHVIRSIFFHDVTQLTLISGLPNNVACYVQKNSVLSRIIQINTCSENVLTMT